MVAIKNGRQEELIWENNYREGRRRRAWRRRRRRWAWPSAQKSAGNTNGVHSKDWSYPAESAGHWRSSTRGQSMTFNVPVSAKKKIISERGDLHANGPRAYHLQLLRGAVGSCALFSARVSFSFLWFLGQKKEVTPVGSKENGLLQSLTRFENGATSRQFEDNFFSSRRSIRLLLGRYSVFPVLLFLLTLCESL